MFSLRFAFPRESLPKFNILLSHWRRFCCIYGFILCPLISHIENAVCCGCAFQRLHIVLLRHSTCTCFEFFVSLTSLGRFILSYLFLCSESNPTIQRSVSPLLNSIQLAIGCLGCCICRETPLDVFIPFIMVHFFGRVDDQTKVKLNKNHMLYGTRTELIKCIKVYRQTSMSGMYIFMKRVNKIPFE